MKLSSTLWAIVLLITALFTLSGCVVPPYGGAYSGHGHHDYDHHDYDHHGSSHYDGGHHHDDGYSY